MYSAIWIGQRAGLQPAPKVHKAARTPTPYSKRRLGFKTISRRCAATLAAAFISGSAWSLTIQSPRPGEQVLPGQTVWVIVQADGAGEDIRAIRILAPGASGCENMVPATTVQCALYIPADPATALTAVDIRVSATLENGAETKASTYVKIGNVETIASLSSDVSGGLPLKFNAIGEEKRLRIFATYSNGSTRALPGNSSGITYETSDPAVVSIKDNGSIVTTGEGTATITVRSSSVSLDIPVIVNKETPTAK